MKKYNVPTPKELEAMQIAGFGSVSALLKRYFELNRAVRKYSTDAVGIAGCKISVSTK